MTQSLLEKNLGCLSGYNKELAQKIAGISELEGNFELKNAKSGDSILYKDGEPLDDVVDPVWRAMEEVKKVKFNIKRSITFVLGLGLGYTFKELAKKYQGKIIIYEPDINTLRIVFELVDYSAELKKDNIRFISDLSELENVYHAFFFLEHRLNVMCSDYYLLNRSSVAAEVKQKLEDTHSIFQSNYRNLFAKNSYWTNLLFRNIPYIINRPDLHELKNKFEGKTAVIISAGPSLDKNIENLKPYRDKVVVFCVGTALKVAVKHGIIPDFAVAVETNYNTYVQLDLPEISDSNLIVSTKVYPEVNKLKAKRIYNYFGINTPISKWLGEVLDIPVDLYKEAGTVSLTAFYSAKLLGCDKFIFIGQDLAYTDNKCYSQDSVYGNFKVGETKTVSVDDTSTLKASLSVTEKSVEEHMQFLSKNMVYVKGQNGGKVLTRVDMVLFIKYFEDIARNFGAELKLINATEGGAYIEGFEHIPLREALEKYTSETIAAENVLGSLGSKPQKIARRRKIILENLAHIVKNYNKSREIIKETYEKHIKNCFEVDFDKLENYISNNRTCALSIKLGGNVGAKTDEDQKVTSGLYELIRENNLSLKYQIRDMYNNSPEKFAEKLSLLKENYLKLDKNTTQNPYLYNLYFDRFMTVNNMLKDYEGWNDCLVCLSYFLSVNMMEFYCYFPEYIDMIIKNTINELERQK